MGLLDFLFRRRAAAGAAADAAPGAAENPRQVFHDQLVQRLRSVAGVEGITPLQDAYGVSVRVRGTERALYFDNLFDETREVPPEEREQRIARYLSVIAPPEYDDTSWEAVRPMLKLALRPGFPPSLGLAGRDEPLCREVLPGLRAHVVIDSPTAVQYAMASSLGRWDVSEEEAFRTAEENLRALTEAGAGAEVYDRTPSPIWHVEAGDDYEASRLLVPGFLASFRDKVEGRPVAIVPGRSMLFVAGDADPQTVVRLCELAEREYAAASRNLSCALYTVDEEGEVEPYLPTEADGVAAQRVRRAHLRFLGTEYESQKRALEGIHEARGIDLFVGSFAALQLADGSVSSFSVWAPGVVALLPQTRLVAFPSADGAETFFVPWVDVVRLAGAQLVREPGLFPPRFRTAELSASVLTALRAASTAGEAH